MGSAGAHSQCAIGPVVRMVARRVALLGGSKGMGRALARVMAARGDAICLLGRDAAELERSVLDLKARGAAAASSAHCDLDDPAGFAGALDQASRSLNG